MSIRVMTTCWEHSQAKGTDLLVLLALADIADDNGECWPSIRHIAKKCRVDERTCQRRIRSLEQLGEVVVIRCGGKASTAGGMRSNRYQITVHIPDDPGESPPPANRHPGTGATQTPAPVPPMTLAPVPPYPSDEPLDEPSRDSLSAEVIHSAGERDQVVHGALVLIADQRVQKAKAAGTLIRNRNAYTSKVLADATAELSDELTERAANNPAFTAEDLAGMFEPVFDPWTQPVGYGSPNEHMKVRLPRDFMKDVLRSDAAGSF